MGQGFNWDLIFKIITASIAFSALIRPELSKLAALIFNKIFFYQSGLLEIGFSEFGPTIAVNGTLRPMGNDQFISKATVKLVRVRDGATYSYEWLVFRNLDFIQQQNSKVEIASAFLIQTGESKKINILFNDVKTLEIYKQNILNFANRYNNYISTSRPKDDEEKAIAREKFIRENESEKLALYSLLGRNMYWQAGKYQMELVWNTHKPEKVFTDKYVFELSPAQFDALDLNRISLIEAAMGAEMRPYFAYTAIHELKKVDS